jgi:hypothetical protein
MYIPIMGNLNRKNNMNTAMQIYNIENSVRRGFTLLREVQGKLPEKELQSLVDKIEGYLDHPSFLETTLHCRTLAYGTL